MSRYVITHEQLQATVDLLVRLPFQDAAPMIALLERLPAFVETPKAPEAEVVPNESVPALTEKDVTPAAV